MASLNSKQPSSEPSQIRALRYTPCVGTAGVPLSVQIDPRGVPRTSSASIILGGKALATKKRTLRNDDGLEKWHLDAVVPYFESGGGYMALVVQVGTPGGQVDNSVVQMACVGTFNYLHTNPFHDALLSRPTVAVKDEDLSSGMSMEAGKLNVGRMELRQRDIEAPSGLDVHTGSGSAPESHLKIVFMAPLEPLAQGWDEVEFQIGRRLVRFTAEGKDGVLKVTPERIAPFDYSADDQALVVSCIYSSHMDSCVITGSDLMLLLEYLCDGEFTIAEANRLRRNLQAFSPHTLSWAKGDGADRDMFSRIMSFGAPMPRKIVRDIKIYPWAKLGVALARIVAKL